MKKLLAFVFLMCLSISIFAQSTPVGISRVANATTAFNVNLPVGWQVINLATAEIWEVKLASGGVLGSNTLTTAASSFQLVNQDISGKLNISDTLNMLANYKTALNARKLKSDSTATDGYVRRDRLTSALIPKEDKSNKVTAFSSPTDVQYPSAILVSDQLNLHVNISDTATMLSHYIKRTDTASMLLNYKNALLQRVKYSDTTGMLTNYRNALNLRLKLSDTASMLNHYAKKTEVALKADKTTTLTINGTAQDLSTNRTWNVGTVTSITKGLGIVAGTITVTGSVAVDTTDASIISRQRAANTYIPNTARGVTVATLVGGKVPLTQIDDVLLGAVNFQNFYNATTNTPTIPTAATANKGWYYIVNAPGTQQSLDLKNGDWIISNGTSWGKVDNNNAVTGVFGRVGAVVATNGDYNTSQVTEVTNLYYTEARVAANSAVALNTAKVTNATHTGDATGATALSVVKIQGIAVDNTAPSTGDFFRNDGTTWKHVAIVNADVPTLYKVETFAEAASGSTGQVNTLTNTPKGATAVQVSLNGGVLKPSQYTVSTNTVQVSIPVYQYDAIVISYCF